MRDEFEDVTLLRKSKKDVTSATWQRTQVNTWVISHFEVTWDVTFSARVSGQRRTISKHETPKNTQGSRGDASTSGWILDQFTSRSCGCLCISRKWKTTGVTTRFQRSLERARAETKLETVTRASVRKTWSWSGGVELERTRMWAPPACTPSTSKGPSKQIARAVLLERMA